jgi:hypothetical protein
MEETTMSRKAFGFGLTFLAALLLVLPMAARVAGASNSKPVMTNMEILNPTSLGGKTVKPGTYTVVADGSTVMLKLGRKVTAEAPARWKESANKAAYSSIVVGAQGIKEIHFEGQTRYVEVTD